MVVSLIVAFVVLVLWLFGRTPSAAGRQTSVRRKPALPPAPPAPKASRASTSGAADVIGGWMLGHQIAHGHDGFPGDPLLGGHLGTSANLAFWGTVFDEDEED